MTAEASPAPPGPTPTPLGPAVRLITVSASYGAGGSVVAPALAARLGLAFLERVTTSEGHIAEPGPCDEQLSAEEVKATPVHRLLAHFTQAMPAGPTQSPPSTHHQDEHLRGYGEAGIHRFLAAGGGVILGRAAAVVLGKDRGFHVRLDGPAERRIVQGAVVEGISEEQARERLRAADKARTAYVRRLYRTDPADASLYHLVIDSTAMPLDAVIELILAAARARKAPVQLQQRGWVLPPAHSALGSRPECPAQGLVAIADEPLGQARRGRQQVKAVDAAASDPDAAHLYTGLRFTSSCSRAGPLTMEAMRAIIAARCCPTWDSHPP